MRGITKLTAIMAKEAQQCLEKSCEMDSSSARILTMLGALYTMNGESDKAIKVLQDATLLDEGVDGTWEILAGVYQNKRNYKKALEAHEKAISINPKFFVHWKGKATDLMCLGRIDESIAAINEALRLAPNDSECQSTLQMLLVLQKKN